ncbi:P-loop containing nucleoside triphosphate hydrolase protein [Xylaria intraflava]|nr:P-loop containing nucleoside triphosphate hydrolase protein [Xylaria intraflava]
MGQKQSKPQPGRKLQVIGAGLSRTGTTSISRALSILLDGPTYHCGTQICRGDDYDIKSWTKLLRHTPIRSAEDKAVVMCELSKLMDGFVAVADIPAFVFVPELMELYPDAKVICTVRDRDEWLVSNQKLLGKNPFVTQAWFFSWLFMFNNPIRHFFPFRQAMADGRVGEVFPTRRKFDGLMTARDWDSHIAFLKEHVPAEKLVFFDVREGWGPLCKALGCEVPEGIDFPRLNDSKALQEAYRSEVRTALGKWAMILGVIVTAYVSWRLYL